VKVTSCSSAPWKMTVVRKGLVKHVIPFLVLLHRFSYPIGSDMGLGFVIVLTSWKVENANEPNVVCPRNPSDGGLEFELIHAGGHRAGLMRLTGLEGGAKYLASAMEKM
jgi:hypothetical protein